MEPDTHVQNEEDNENDTFGLDHVPNCNLKCRFYEEKYPSSGDVIMARWNRVDTTTGAYVHLLEYNNIEALLVFTEFTNKRTRQVHKLIKIGKNTSEKEPLLVIKVDNDKGFIDLSRKRVNPEDIKACKARYNKHLKAHNIMRQTAAWLEEDLEKLYERVGWPLAKQFNSLYDAFMISLSEPEQVFSRIEIDDKTKDLLMDNISKRMKPVNTKISSTFELTCYTFEGIDAIQRALKESLAKIEEDKESDEEKLNITLIKSPLYECYTHRNVKIQEGFDKIEILLKYIEESITESKGKFILSRYLSWFRFHFINLEQKPIALGIKEEEMVENKIKKYQDEQLEDNRSEEEDNDEGMGGFDLEDHDESDNKSANTTATEDKKQDSDEDED